jgi:TonB-linked SusC/RagA family outer membrane protein
MNVHKKRKSLILFLMFCPVMCFTSLDAQTKTEVITLDQRNKPVKEIIKAIEASNDYVFFYNKEDLDRERIATVQVKEAPIEKVLELLFAGTNNSWRIDGSQVFVTVKEKLAPKPSNSSNKKRISGKIIDENDEPMPGALIGVKGSPRGVATDIDGTFSIDASPEEILEISFLGYEKMEVPVGQQTYIGVKLEPKKNELDEVVVVAYGKQKKENVVGAVSTINARELKIPSSNLTTAFAGKLAGIVAYQTSGEPGMDDASFFVRGVTSLTYASGPLILIDGVESTSSDLSRMQPDDIANFSIMKDATATALYGARGANGVIAITTKEGHEGQTKISFRAETSLSTPTSQVELADPISYMQLNNEAVQTRDRKAGIPYSREKIDNTMNPNRNTYVYPANDWYNLLMNDYTLNYRANLNISGGGKVARYYIAATFNQDNGNLKMDKQNNFNNNIDLKKYMLRSNVDINMTPTTKAVVRLAGTFDDYIGPIDGGAELYSKIMRSDPVLFPPTFAPDESTAHLHHILFGNANAGLTSSYINPYADMVKGYREYNKSKMMAQFELQQKLDFVTSGLAFRALFSTNRYSYRSVSRSYKPYYYAIAGYNKATDKYTLQWLNNSQGKAEEWLSFSEAPREIEATNYTEAALTYDRMFAKKHAVSGLLVGTLRNYIQNIGDEATGVLELSLPHRNMGISGRATYAYDNRYFTEFNFGYNGSERFAKQERFGFFPSVGAAWTVSNENFWTDNNNLTAIMPKLKLKATYGLVGNDAIGNADDRFYYLSRVIMNNSGRAYSYGYDFNNTYNGVSVERYANEMITWEVSRKTNFGIEINLFNKLDIMADFYRENRSGILLDRVYVPASMGLGTLSTPPQANLGRAIGEGMDFSVDYQHFFNKDFWMTGRVNFTYATTEYTEYEELDYSATPWLSRIGLPVSQAWGYIAERLFVDDAEVANSPTQNFGDTRPVMGGDIKYKDLDGDGKITELDKAPIGYPTEPQIVYGFGLSTGYKMFDLSFFFQGLGQRSFWIDATATSPFVDTDGNAAIISKNAMLQYYADNHWTEDNRNLYALWPRLSDVVVKNNTQTSTWFLRDASFLRLKSLELGYTIPENIMKKIRCKTFRIYFSGTNLLCFSKFKLWDPEMAGNGLGYPLQKVYNLGLQFTF